MPAMNVAQYHERQQEIVKYVPFPICSRRSRRRQLRPKGRRQNSACRFPFSHETVDGRAM